MADDGMVLNFAVGDSVPSIQRKTKFEGGSWKDRASAKRRAQHRERNGNSLPLSLAQISANHVPVKKVEQEEYPDPRPAKRRRENDHSIDKTNTALPSDRRHKRDQHQQYSSRDVVSSLFTSNPKPTHPTLQAKETNPGEETSKPSNAPLVDGIDTFTSLGLSATIATHLLTKMDLKNPTAIQKAAISQMLKEHGDAFIQAETGSGKTLAYLLPIVQRMMRISKQRQKRANDSDTKALHRNSGLFAIILAPTRELCKQISVVLERLLGCAHYIVAGTVIGGEKKKSEKARLRKGINILVATPGRLVDHLDNTSVLDVRHVRWLVLDEGDRLMDLGFEQDITKIVTTLDQGQKTDLNFGLPARRTTVLCSATLKMNVQKLGEISLKDAALIRGDASDDEVGVERNANGGKDSAFLAPAQLKQSYLVVPAKLRLVTLIALLRRTFARKGSVNKAIVFLSCADSVDFHFKAFTRSIAASETTDTQEPEHNSSTSPSPPAPTLHQDSICLCPLLSSSGSQPLQIHKLHGSLSQQTRTAITNTFRTTTDPSLLIATDVASRGLDLPNLDLVIEYDPAFSADDHLHRIGRTARLGRDGRAIVFLMPGKEEGYSDVLKGSYKKDLDGVAGTVKQDDTNDLLRKGFTPTSGIVNQSPKEWEARATEFQLDVERWVLSEQENREMAKRAFQSHVRAYATHVASERKYFDIKELHLGHLAKAFGLREAPKRMNVQGMRGDTRAMGKGGRGRDRKEGVGGNRGAERSGEGEGFGADDSAKKMREMVRKQKKMMMGAAGADEFNIG